MQAHVHHQPDGPVHFAAQRTHVLVRVGVEPELLAQGLAIQRPALAKSAVAAKAPEFGQGRVFILQRNLVVVARNGFV